ncbi:MAG: RdgB/HAM1 family non-canonical purine NTP pyrophosphatase [Verrucomicrobia bacterium]|jgi:XTP/dITP diphosphohydrolase|nr:RdgB/HAM1 family non-canonical purine NTP pyrophosphatase [Verrucomicrobiota bacterium]MBT5063224.1 RdgB/HAM1 family non-canonical purine NTP pyrophosphatase [Verrucomicrobiota bacterium]MBT5478877.1 RdgB/HAM1 family non-canonical purine NTP pyrophosphatase [Verrucomicrobiota bacterium]MBT6239491.1 RdgB/HAM1 family non-canonical purine NTP pyrophosphatase [Verrucomicrobiota bacterium]MBT6803822.1 RdgB/HAM1 family non-canonical purine NTP pyrophosphatase [Verrucomicrobiota bacterium]
MKPGILYIATGNEHKVSEIAEMLGNSVRCLSMKSLASPPDLIEDGDTFEANALAKASQLEAWLKTQSLDNKQYYVLADDSGLEVDALGGRPGVFSARFAADETACSGNATDEANNAKLIRLLKEVPEKERTGRFRCVLALIHSFPKATASGQWTFSGSCEGHLMLESSGDQGFGYDPLFRPMGFDQTFAELGATIKNRISHRSHALQKLQTFLSRT